VVEVDSLVEFDEEEELPATEEGEA